MSRFHSILAHQCANCSFFSPMHDKILSKGDSIRTFDLIMYLNSPPFPSEKNCEIGTWLSGAGSTRLSSIKDVQNVLAPWLFLCAREKSLNRCNVHKVEFKRFKFLPSWWIYSNRDLGHFSVRACQKSTIVMVVCPGDGNRLVSLAILTLKHLQSQAKH